MAVVRALIGVNRSIQGVVGAFGAVGTLALAGPSDESWRMLARQEFATVEGISFDGVTNLGLEVFGHTERIPVGTASRFTG